MYRGMLVDFVKISIEFLGLHMNAKRRTYDFQKKCQNFTALLRDKDFHLV